MSWGNYTPGESGRSQDRWGGAYPGYHSNAGQDASTAEPSGYVTSDPYGPSAYNTYAQAQSPYGTSGRPASNPYHYGAPVYAYTDERPPRPEVGFVEALTLFFKNYAVFHGRASRSEYWWVMLWSAIFNVGTLALFIGAAASTSASASMSGIVVAIMLLWGAVWLGTLVPSISLQVRRLHDAGFSGFFTLFGYVVPYVGWMVPAVMSFSPSAPNGIQYDNPNGTQPAV